LLFLLISNASCPKKTISLSTVIDAATITGLAAGIGWAAKKVTKENFTSDSSGSAMNYVKFTAVVADSIALKEYLEDQKARGELEECVASVSPYHVGYVSNSNSAPIIGPPLNTPGRELQ